MYQFKDFVTAQPQGRFDAEGLLKSARAMLVDQSEYDVAGIASHLSLRLLEAARFVFAFSVGNAGGNAIHFVKTQSGSLSDSRYRFTIQPIDGLVAERQESRLAA